jgi:NAD(P)-dependent dehydrogenase (short-subunit alcohol dehydrogenase family)
MSDPAFCGTVDRAVNSAPGWTGEALLFEKAGLIKLRDGAGRARDCNHQRGDRHRTSVRACLCGAWRECRCRRHEFRRRDRRGGRCRSASMSPTIHSLAPWRQTFGRIDGLITNAAYFREVTLTPFEDLDSAVWDRIFAVNVKGVWHCCKSVAPAMRKSRLGSIVSVSSRSSPSPASPAICTTSRPRARCSR